MGLFPLGQPWRLRVGVYKSLPAPSHPLLSPSATSTLAQWVNHEVLRGAGDGAAASLFPEE